MVVLVISAFFYWTIAFESIYKWLEVELRWWKYNVDLYPCQGECISTVLILKGSSYKQVGPGTLNCSRGYLCPQSRGTSHHRMREQPCQPWTLALSHASKPYMGTMWAMTSMLWLGDSESSLISPHLVYYCLNLSSKCSSNKTIPVLIIPITVTTDIGR